MLLKLTCLVPLFPLIGSIINGFFGLKIGKNAVGLIACGSMALSFLTSDPDLYRLSHVAGRTAHL